MPVCSNCAEENPAGSSFCQQCGTRVELTEPEPERQCSVCGTAADDSMRFCMSCGTALSSLGGARSQRTSAPPPETAVEASSRPRRSTPEDFDLLDCTECEARTPAGYRFCQACGAHLRPPSSAPELVRPDSPAIAQDSAPAPRREMATLVEMAGMVEVELDRWGRLVSINPDGTVGSTRDLVGPWVTCGRSGADVEFLSDPQIASHHFRLEPVTGGVQIVPLDRINGVYLRITERIQVTESTRLLLGRELFRVERISGAEAGQSALVRGGVRLFGSPVRPAWGRLVQMLASGADGDVTHMVDDQVILGREEGHITFPDDEFMSYRHGALSKQGGEVWFEDLGSSNGSFEWCAGPTVLGAGSLLRAGDQLLRLEL